MPYAEPPFPIVKFLRIAGAVFGALLLLFAVFGSLYSVDEGEQAVITRFGAVVRVVGSGLHVKAPFVESVVRVSTRILSVEWLNGYDENKKPFDARMESYSRDQQPAHVGLKITYRAKADAGSIQRIYAQYGDLAGCADRLIIPRTYEAVKTVFGQFTAVRAIQERGALNADTDSALRRSIGDDAPVVIEGVQIQDVAFSPSYEAAVEQRMKAEVEVQQVTQNLERERKSAEIAVVQAQGQADSQLAKARADATAIKLRGEAEASAIQARSAALRDSPRLVELTLAEKWDGKLPSTMIPGGAVPFINTK